MSIPFLFGGSDTRTKNLVEFRAGKMRRNGTTVSPVKTRKGLVYLHISEEDSLMHFCWKDRTTGHVEDVSHSGIKITPNLWALICGQDLVVLPGEAEFKKVSQCTTGRVFVLKFKQNNRCFFYWSQEPKEDKDEEWVNKINEYINSSQ